MERIQLRRDTSEKWASVNPVLMEGEVGIETDTKLRKVGDGVNAWNSLDYLAAENIVQELGDSENATVSQKAITDELKKYSLTSVTPDRYECYVFDSNEFIVVGGGKKNEDGSYSFTNSAEQNKITVENTGLKLTGKYIVAVQVSKITIANNSRGFRYYLYDKNIRDYSTITGLRVGTVTLNDEPLYPQIMIDSVDLASGISLGSIKFEKFYVIKYDEDLWNKLSGLRDGVYYDLVNSVESIYANHYPEQETILQNMYPLNPAPYHDYTGANTTGKFTSSKTELSGIVFRDNDDRFSKIDFHTTKVWFTFTKNTGLKSVYGYTGINILNTLTAESIELNKQYTMYWTGTPGSDNGISNIISQFRVETSGDTVDTEYTIDRILVYKGIIPESVIDENVERNKYKIVCSDYSNVSYDTLKGVINNFTKDFTPIDFTVKGQQISYNKETKEFIFTGDGTDKYRIIDTNAKKLLAGEDYIFIAAVPFFETYSEYVNNCNVTYHSQSIATISYAGLYIERFTATEQSGSSIQIIPRTNYHNTELNGVTFLKMKLLYFGIVKYSDILYNTLINIKNTITDNKLLEVLSPIIPYSVFSYDLSNYFIDASLKIYEDQFPNLKNDVNNVVKKWNSVAAGGTQNIVTSNGYTTATFIMPKTYSNDGDKHRNYFGFSIQENYEELGADDFVIVFKGTIQGKNISRVYLGNIVNDLLTQDVEDDTEIAVQGMITLNHPTGNNRSNGVYFYAKEDPSTGIETRMTTKTNCYFICKYVEGYSIDDYIKIYEKNNLNYYPINSNPDGVTKEELDQAISEVESKIAEDVISGYDLNYDADVNMLINYGQSLSVGGSLNNTSADFHKMLTFQGGGNEWKSDVKIEDEESVANYYGTDLLLFEDVDTSVTVGAPVGCNALAWMNRLEEENNVDLDNFEYQFLLSTPGYSGAPIESFIKGTYYYKRLLFSVTKGKELANKAGKTFNVPALFWVQGEGNTQQNPSNHEQSELDYYNKLKQMFADLNADIKAITGQSNDVAFVTYQQSPVLNITWNDKLYQYSGPSWAHLRAALELDNVYLGGAMYQFDYGTDLWHPVDRNVVGLQAGIVAKKIINDKKPYPVFYPSSTKIEKDEINNRWILSIKYNVPVPPMRFDVSGDSYHNINGKQPNYGFSLVNSANESIIVSEPTISRGNTLNIICSENPVGAKLSYATTGHFGGGNLCDSQNVIVTVSNKNYVIDNFAPAFKEYIIN